MELDKIRSAMTELINSHTSEISIIDADEVVFSYIAGILEESLDEIDLEEFMSITDAYIPGFASIPQLEIREFLKGLTTPETVTQSLPSPVPSSSSCVKTKRSRRMKESRRSSECDGHAEASAVSVSNTSSTPDTISHRTVSESSSISEYDWPTLSDRPRLRSICDSSAVSISSSRTNSESYDDSLSAPEVGVRERSVLQDDTQSLACGGNISSPVEELTQQLREMFPGKCVTDIQSSLKSNSNDMEKAVEWLLSDSQTTNTVLTSHKKHRPVKGSNITVDLTTMKSMKSKRSSNRSRKKSNSQSNEDGYSAEDGLETLPAADVRALIVDKYSYIPTDEEKKTFTPKLQTNEDKKMLRYRDGQVVSTKGERYSDVKPKVSEDMKKTYINLKPAKQYRFH